MKGKKSGVSCWCNSLISLAAQRGHWEYDIKEGTTFSGLEPVVQSKVLQFGAVEDPRSILDRIVREVARKMLQAALEEEVNSFLEMHSSKIDDMRGEGK